MRKNSQESRLIRDFAKKARRIVDRIAKNRDDLRSLLSEYTEILESTEDAHDEFERALDTLSQFA